jgi:hypothetical protein
MERWNNVMIIGLRSTLAIGYKPNKKGHSRAS